MSWSGAAKETTSSQSQSRVSGTVDRSFDCRWWSSLSYHSQLLIVRVGACILQAAMQEELQAIQESLAGHAQVRDGVHQRQAAVRTIMGEGFEGDLGRPATSAPASSHSRQSSGQEHPAEGTAHGDGIGADKGRPARGSLDTQQGNTAPSQGRATVETVTGAGSAARQSRLSGSSPAPATSHSPLQESSAPARTITGEGFEGELSRSANSSQHPSGGRPNLPQSPAPARTVTGESFQAELSRPASSLEDNPRSTGPSSLPARTLTGEGFQAKLSRPVTSMGIVPCSTVPTPSAARTVTGEGFQAELSRPATSRPEAPNSSHTPSAARTVTGEGFQAELSRPAPSMGTAPRSTVPPSSAARTVTGEGFQAELSRPAATRPETPSSSQAASATRTVTGEGFQAELSRPAPSMGTAPRSTVPPSSATRTVTGEGFQAELSRPAPSKAMAASSSQAHPARTVTGEGFQAELSRPAPSLQSSTNTTTSMPLPARTVTGDDLQAELSRPAPSPIAPPISTSLMPSPARTVTGEGFEAELSRPPIQGQFGMPAAASHMQPSAVPRAVMRQSLDLEIAQAASRSHPPTLQLQPPHRPVTGEGFQAGAQAPAPAAPGDLMSPTDHDQQAASSLKRVPGPIFQTNASPAQSTAPGFSSLLGDLSPGLPQNLPHSQNPSAVESPTSPQLRHQTAAPEISSNQANSGAEASAISTSQAGVAPSAASGVSLDESRSRAPRPSIKAGGLPAMLGHPQPAFPSPDTSPQQLPDAREMRFPESPVLGKPAATAQVAGLSSVPAGVPGPMLQAPARQGATRMLEASLEGLASSPLDPDMLRPDSPISKAPARQRQHALQARPFPSAAHAGKVQDSSGASGAARPSGEAGSSLRNAPDVDPSTDNKEYAGHGASGTR